jgi:hypothetical protein
MKPKTRDNLIYLAVGLSIAAFVAEQVFYSESHGRAIANLSSFAFRAATSTLMVGYFVGRAVRNLNATLAEVVLCVVVAGVMQLAISFGFHQYVGQLSGMSYVGLVALETFFIVNLATWTVSHFRARPGGA